MYAVIKTGGKQYRVRAGDLLVVERLDGDPGSVVAFDEVLLIGEGAEVTLGAPVVAGARVNATLIETRKGEKIKVFKKIRRQGYRRTRGHRQFQSVLRVTGIEGEGRSESWDGTVNLTPLAVLNARARNLARGMEAAETRKEGRRASRARIATAAPAMVKQSEAAAPVAKPKAAPAPKVKAKAAAAPKAKASAPKPKASETKASETKASGTKAAKPRADAAPAKKTASAKKAAPAKKAKAPAAPKDKA